MPLLIDATTAQHARGIGTVIEGIIEGLPRDASYAVIVAAGPDYLLPDSVSQRRIAIARTRPGRLLYQRLLLPADTALLARTTGRVDRVLLLDTYVPLIRPSRGVRYATLVHDVLPLTHPEFWPLSKRMVKRAAFASLRRAHVTVFTSTEHNARFIRELMGIESRVVHFGCGQVRDAEADDALNTQLPSQDRHLLYIGALEPRKNVVPLIGVFDQATSDLGLELDLVLIGDGPGSYVNALADRIARSPFSDRIHLIGGSSRETAMQLMRSARALIFPSRAEGFGLPIVEALALGTPVIASDIPAIRSWAGDAVLYSSGGGALKWVEAIAAALTSGAARRRAGQEFARDYRWRRCATEIIDF